MWYRCLWLLLRRRTLSAQPEATPPGPLPPNLEEIVTGSNPSLRVDGTSTVMSFRFRVIRSPVALRWPAMKFLLMVPGPSAVGRVAWSWRDFERSRIVFGTCWRGGQIEPCRMTHTCCSVLMIHCGCWVASSGFPRWTWPLVTGR